MDYTLYAWAWSQALMLTGCRVVIASFSPQYQVQKYIEAVCGKSVEHSLKQDEYSGSAVFVVAPSGCFLRKLFCPVCAGSIRKYRTNWVYLYIAQPLPNWGFLAFRPFFSLFLLHHLSGVLHMVYTALSVNTGQQRTRELLQLPHQNTNSQFSQSPVIVHLLWKWCSCFKLKGKENVSGIVIVMASLWLLRDTKSNRYNACDTKDNGSVR